MKAKTFCRAACGLSVMLVSYPVLALDTTLAVGLSALHTSNSNRTPTNEQSDLQRIADMDITALHDGNRVDLDASYNVARVDFKDDTQQDTTIYNGDATLSWDQIQNTLTWRLANSIREVSRDKSLTNIRDNQESRSITTASGTLSSRPGRTNTVSFTGSYSDIRFEDSNNRDSENLGGTLTFSRALSQVSSLSLTGSYIDVSFDDGVNDYEYYNASLGYSASLSKLSYNISAGYNEQNLDSGSTFNGTYYQVNANYVDAGSIWSLVVQQRLSDTSSGNYNISVSGLSNYSTTSGANSVYERTSAELSFSNTTICSGCTWGVRALGEQERYEQSSGDDNDELALSTTLGYAITRNVNLSGQIQYRDVNFVGQNPRVDYKLDTYRLTCNVAVSRDLSVSLFTSYEERSSDDSATDYDDLRGGIALDYQIK